MADLSTAHLVWFDEETDTTIELPVRLIVPFVTAVAEAHDVATDEAADEHRERLKSLTRETRRAGDTGGG